jgi:hypothetical protein
MLGKARRYQSEKIKMTGDEDDDEEEPEDPREAFLQGKSRMPKPPPLYLQYYR